MASSFCLETSAPHVHRSTRGHFAMVHQHEQSQSGEASPSWYVCGQCRMYGMSQKGNQGQHQIIKKRAAFGLPGGGGFDESWPRESGARAESDRGARTGTHLREGGASLGKLRFLHVLHGGSHGHVAARLHTTRRGDGWLGTQVRNDSFQFLV